MHVTEQKWDKVKSNRTLRSSVAHATATDKLAKVARSMGVDEVMRWKAASVSYPFFSSTVESCKKISLRGVH